MSTLLRRLALSITTHRIPATCKFADQLQQSLAPEARMPSAADDEVVVQLDAQHLGRRLDFLGHGDGVARGHRIAAGMVVLTARPAGLIALDFSF